MNYQDLDKIIDEYEKTSYYNLVLKINGYSFKKFLLKSLIIFVISIPLIAPISIWFKLKGFDNMPLLLIPFFITLTLSNLKFNKLTKKYIKEYSNAHSLELELKSFSEIRFNEFYNIINNNFEQILLDKNFELLISYLESKEKRLFMDSEYSVKVTILISSIISCIAGIVSGIIPQLIENLQVVYKIIIIVFIVSIGILIYFFGSSLFTFPTKINTMKNTYKDLKSFLYKAKFRYNLEHQNENLINANNDFNESKENVRSSSAENNNFSIITKTKLHKIIDLIFD